MQKLDLQIKSPKQLIDYLRGMGHVIADEALPKPLTWPTLIEFKTNTGENIFHLLATIKMIKDLTDTLSTVFYPEQIQKQVMAQNNNHETPFHLVCKCANRELFEYIIKHLTPRHLQELAQIKTRDCGYNPFHLLCVSPYNERIIKFRSLFEGQEQLPNEMRYPLGHIELSVDHIILMERFPQIFGEDMNQLFSDVDKNGNNALMLCCYTCLSVWVDCCAKACKDKNRLLEAVKSGVPGTQLTPMKLICAYASFECVDAFIRDLGDFAQRACVEENALSWCFRTQVPEHKRQDFYRVLQCVASAYGNQLEENVLPNDKAPSLLWHSLLTDGAIAEIILNKKHVSKQSKLLCDLLIDQHKLKLKDNSANQHFFSAPAAVDAEKLFKSLLLKLFKIAWPEVTVQYIAKAMIAEYANTQLAMHDCKTKMMNIILLKEQPNVTIPLALFYKVKPPYTHAEQQYFTAFLADDALFEEFASFYRILKSLSNGKLFAKNFLERIFQGRSLLKAALLQKLPFAEHLDKTVKERFIRILEDSLSAVECRTQDVKAIK